MRILECVVSIIAGVVLFVLFSAEAVAQTRHVPTDYPTIQAGINAASDGDTIEVADGTYYEHDIDFLGKAITLKSENGPQNCIIDCGENGRAF